MEIKESWVTAQADSLKSVGECNLSARIEECLMYVRNKDKTYADIHDMALDYGKYGTNKFFPFSQLVQLIESDNRFERYLKVLTINTLGKTCSNWRADVQ